MPRPPIIAVTCGVLAATLYQMVTGEPPRVIDLNDVPEDLRPCLTQGTKTEAR